MRIFSRQLNDVTDSAPEIVEAVRVLPVEALVLDGEALGFDRQGRPLPFQVTMQRFGRRRDVAALRPQIPLTARWFDCLYRDGRALTNETGAVRHEALCASVPPALRVERLVTADNAEARRFLARALAAGHEGVMAKSLTAYYQAGHRGADWLKIKPVHTLDLVVLAAEWGSGRRKGKLSNLHLGARDSADGRFAMLGKTFKGLTDRLLAWQTGALLARETHREGPVVYVRPELVVEVAFNGLQQSSQYPAGMALRFARVKRYRDDKSPTEADTLNTVRRIFAFGFRERAS